MVRKLIPFLVLVFLGQAEASMLLGHFDCEFVDPKTQWKQKFEFKATEGTLEIYPGTEASEVFRFKENWVIENPIVIDNKPQPPLSRHNPFMNLTNQLIGGVDRGAVYWTRLFHDGAVGYLEVTHMVFAPSGDSGATLMYTSNTLDRGTGEVKTYLKKYSCKKKVD